MHGGRVHSSGHRRGRQAREFDSSPLVHLPPFLMPWRPECEPPPAPGQDLEAQNLADASSRISLSSDVPVDLIRAVPLDLCLQSCGVHFSGKGSDEARGYELSEKADHIEAFLSHDWQTSRWHKTFALWLIFNSVPAAWACFVVSLVCSGLLTFFRLPGGWQIASSLCYAVFYFFLVFWQPVRRVFCCRRFLVFLDRLCIAQHDEGLKQAARSSMTLFFGSSYSHLGGRGTLDERSLVAPQTRQAYSACPAFLPSLRS